ncbi:GNAT family N-acetyltransferase [Alteromonas sp. H39]|uniref:GNAT family N-acetyltransferase n=1 Tax=Alteromonas sp. H39 TaxID=3389876 RepID=UPI0039E1FA1F
MTFRIENVDWMRGRDRLEKLREHVFVLEWRLPREAEFDEHDDSAFHVLIIGPGDTPVATGRLTQQGEIGRVAVKRQYRSLRMYKRLFNALVSLAKAHDVPVLHVSCDLDSVNYHEKLGFTPNGPVFMEAGIPRQKMACDINRFTLPDVTHMH